MIRIGIVDDHKIVRQCLKAFFLGESDFQVVGEGGSGREAIDLVRTSPMDVLVMDLSMPGQSGLDAIAMLHAKYPEVGILILSAYAEEQYALALIRTGASGYLNKQCEPDEIALAIRTISLGRRYISAGVSELLANQFTSDDRAPHRLLSDREFQVFLKLSQGERAGAIASDLSLSVKTISTYRTRILEKMHMLSNSDMTHYAVKSSLLA
jgi:two-component system invasion response regulator UvrY